MSQAILAYYSRSDIVLVKRDASGSRVETRVPAMYSSYLKSPTPLAIQMINHLIALGDITRISIKDSWTRINWKDRDTRLAGTALNGWLAKSGVVHFEADINPIRR